MSHWQHLTWGLNYVVTMWPSKGQWHFSVYLAEGQRGLGDISPSVAVPLPWWSLVGWGWHVTWRRRGRLLEQIEELWPCFGGEKCCATSEDRRAGKKTDSREMLKQNVIQTNVCPCDHCSSLAWRVSVFGLYNNCVGSFPWTCYCCYTPLVIWPVTVGTNISHH